MIIIGAKDWEKLKRPNYREIVVSQLMKYYIAIKDNFHEKYHIEQIFEI